MSEGGKHPRKPPDRPSCQLECIASNTQRSYLLAGAVSPLEAASGLGADGIDVPPLTKTDRPPSERAVQPRYRGSSDEEHGDEKRFKLKPHSLSTPPSPGTPSPPPRSRIPLMVRSVRSGPFPAPRTCYSSEVIHLPQPRSPTPTPCSPSGDGEEAPTGLSSTSNVRKVTASTPNVDCEGSVQSHLNSSTYDSTAYVEIESMPLEAPTNLPAPAPRITTSYAAATARAPACRTTPSPAATQQAPTANQKTYPPIVVESLPNWTAHFATLHRKLGHTPHARPLGKGVRFIPRSQEEYREIQRYLTDAMQADPTISWYCYSMASELPTKVAVRGLPVDTSTEDIRAALEAENFSVRYVRTIKPKRGRAGCLFHVQLDHLDKEELVRLYRIQELLYMPGITIEAWRGAVGGIPQCHRCQAFGHASANCHRPQRCVRCGDGHPATECPRSMDDKPTCANCKKAHTANDRRCTVFRREARKRGKKIPTSLAPPDAPKDRYPTAGLGERPKLPNHANAVSQGATFLTTANPPTERGTPVKKSRRSRGRRGRKQTPTVASSTPMPKKTQVHFAESRTAPALNLAPTADNIPYASVAPPVKSRSDVPPQVSAQPQATKEPQAVPATDRAPKPLPEPCTFQKPTMHSTPDVATSPLPQECSYSRVPTETQRMAASASGGDPILTLFGVLLDMLSSIASGEDLLEMAKRGLAQIKLLEQ